MKNLADTPSFLYLILMLLVISNTGNALSQTKTLAKEIQAQVKAEIETQHRQEQEAFIKGDCDKVASFYSDEATRYLNGRLTSPEEGREFCNKIPRPFTREGQPPKITDNFYVLSDNAAHFVRTIDFEPTDNESPAFKREVVTKVWEKLNDEWKIVHFHSSVHSILDD